MWINPFFDDSPGAPVLTELFPNWAAGDGIFDVLEEVADVPWEGSVQSADLDLDYFGNHSGAKFGAPLPVKLWLNGDLELSDEDRKTLARIIWLKFKQPWEHLWEVGVAEYNPIDNYNMVEQRNLARQEDRTSETITGEESSSETGSTSNALDSVYGLNSPDGGKPSNGYESDDTTSNESSFDRTENQTDAKNTGEAEVILRRGNIGVTTTQQMIEQERKLWEWNFFEKVYKDIDTVLALAVYDGCRV